LLQFASEQHELAGDASAIKSSRGEVSVRTRHASIRFPPAFRQVRS